MTDVTAMCLAAVDLVVRVSDDELKAVGIAKEDDVNVSSERIAELLSVLLPRGKIMPGGPAANTVAGVAALGGQAAFIGKVADDELGRAFMRDFQRRGVIFNSKNEETSGTACCIVFVTSDSKRSILCHRGVGDNVTPEDILSSRDVLGRTRILHLGLLARDLAHAESAELARRYAPQAKTATSLQSYLQPGTPATARYMLKADIILGNEPEFAAFADDLGQPDVAALARAYPEKIFARTLAENGADIHAGGECILIPATPAEVKDSTGAGDAWAAGFLYGLSRQKPLDACGRLGGACAAQILAEEGGRSRQPWTHLLKKGEEYDTLPHR